MSFSKEIKIEILEKFVGSRYYDEETEALFNDELETIKETVYRGMPFPKHLLKKGYVVEQWYDSCHWTLDFDIAKNKFANDTFNISECYVEDLSKELNITYEETEALFVPIVLKLDGVSSGVRIYEMVKDLDRVSRFYDEKEIATFGIDVVIKDFNLISDEDGEYYIVNVEEIN